MGRAVAVVLIGVVVTAPGAKEQAGQGKQHNAGQEHCSEIEPSQSSFHQCAPISNHFGAVPGFVGQLLGTQEQSLIRSRFFVFRRSSR